MEPAFEQYQTIQHYLDEKLTPAQQAAFMREVEASETLRDNLLFEIELRNSLGMLAAPVPAAQKGFVWPLSAVRGNGKAARKKKVISLGAVIAVAASLVIVAAASVWFFLNPFQKTPVAKTETSQTTAQKEKVTAGRDSTTIETPDKQLAYANLYKQFYTKDDAPLPAETPDLLAEALFHYEEGNYTRLQALDLRRLPSERGPASPGEEQYIRELGHYYQALSYVETADTAKAQTHLDWVIANGQNKTLIQKASWYKALLFVKQGDAASAAGILSKVAAGKANPFGKKAAALLQLLRQ